MSAKPRIAVLIGAAWPGNDASGPVQSVRQIAARFAGEAHFELFARSGAPGEPPLAPHGERREEAWGATTYLDIGAAGARNLRGAVAAVRCDRVWLNSVWDREFTLPALAWRRIGAGIPRDALLSTRGEFSAGALALHSGRKRLMRRALAVAGMLRGVTFHATSDDEARDVAASFPNRPILVAGNIRGLPNQLAHEAAGETLQLLYLGRISPVKGLHNALGALAHVTTPTKLTVCGPVHDAAYDAQCRALLADLPPHVSVEFAGPVANADAAARYAAADLFLNPSASENFGHTIFESLAAGTPVLTGIATPWNGLEGAQAGFNVPSENHTALARAIDRFAALPSGDRARWRTAARARVEQQASDLTTLGAWRGWLTGGLPRGPVNPRGRA